MESLRCHRVTDTKCFLYLSNIKWVWHLGAFLNNQESMLWPMCPGEWCNSKDFILYTSFTSHRSFVSSSTEVRGLRFERSPIDTSWCLNDAGKTPDICHHKRFFMKTLGWSAWACPFCVQFSLSPMWYFILTLPTFGGLAFLEMFTPPYVPVSNGKALSPILCPPPYSFPEHPHYSLIPMLIQHLLAGISV